MRVWIISPTWHAILLSILTFTFILSRFHLSTLSYHFPFLSSPVWAETGEFRETNHNTMASVTNMDHSQMNFQAQSTRNRNRDRKADGKFKGCKWTFLINLSCMLKIDENVKNAWQMSRRERISRFNLRWVFNCWCVIWYRSACAENITQIYSQRRRPSKLELTFHRRVPMQ